MVLAHARAALRAQAAAEEARRKAEMEEEYNNWHKLCDLTDTTGVMRVVRLMCGTPLS
jgi:invasion protein IalB